MADANAPKVYYNEIDAYCAQWLRNLMDAGHIPQGVIDTRSIEDVRPDELAGYTQCHFFAGIGGWPYALALAGWSVDRPVWTGSCPCQPFSAAGKGLGFTDQRHLWPAWFHLISQCQPPVVFGEQVAAAVGKGWLDGVCADLEGHGYAIGAAVLPACAVDAPHRRDRLWFVADRGEPGLAQGISQSRILRAAGGKSEGKNAAHDVQTGSLVNDNEDGCEQGSIAAAPTGHRRSARATAWSDFRWVICHDGKARRVQSGLQPLGNGFSARMGRLRAYGNAIVPQVAAEFIGAYLEARELIAENEPMALLRDRA